MDTITTWTPWKALLAVFAGQGKDADAERLCKRAFAIQEEILGPEHYQVSVTLDNRRPFIVGQESSKLLSN
jgi:hypothetical protein